MIELEELKELHDKAYDRGQVTRDRSSDDLIFYWITQWDDNLLGESQLQYRGEFNIIRKAGRQIMSNIHANPVQVDFDPKRPNDDNGADILDGLYRSDARINSSKEAFDNAVNEAIVCGVGGWELVNEYETDELGERNQVIRRKPIYEANNTVLWDPNASRLDKSDANYVSILTRYSSGGYTDLVKELTGEDSTGYGDSFKYPNESYVFPWVAQEDHVWVVTFYHREKVKTTVYTFVDIFDNENILRDDEIDGQMDALVDGGYNLVDERTYERWEVTRYVASGEQILETSTVPGSEIPVIPCYGERAFVEGEEHYEGITRLAKDPQRLRNFQLSYLADIVSRSPRNKKIYHPEQIQGFEAMYEESGADNNFPYLLANRTTANGEPLPVGPIGETGEQTMPMALVQSIELSRQAVEDVANPGLPQNLADPDISGKAAMVLQERMDMQSFIYQSNYKHACRRDGEIYASMAKVIYDSPRDVVLTLYDGSRKQETLMKETVDPQTMMRVTENDLTQGEFDVFADVGPSFTSQKQQTRAELKELINGMPPGDPTRDILMMKYMMLMDGTSFDDMRDYARKQLILKGINEPETEEEKAMMAEVAQNQQPDAMMVAAQAEQTKAQADMAGAENKSQANQIDAFEAETDRMKVQIDAKEAGVRLQMDAADKGAKLQKNQLEMQGIQIDNALKVGDRLRASVAPR